MTATRVARSAASAGAGVVLRRLWRPLAQRASNGARRAGIDRLYVVVSLDCDTDEDAEVVRSVHDRLIASGICPAYAVPGAQLERSPQVYADIAASGAEMLNHGWQQHCHLDVATRTYESSFFYDTLSWAEVERDVRRGHATHLAVLGHPPAGFRTPHFGTFQRRQQLDRLHRLLAALGYRYSTSSGPMVTMQRGPVFLGDAGVWELPVSGGTSAPHRPLDTWSFRFAPGRRGREQQYLDEVRALVALHVDRGLPGIVNLYGDPTQVDDWPEWFELMAELAPHAVTSYRDLLARVA